MSFFKETPRILSIIFIITGIIGFIWNAGTLIELSEISQLHNGLSVLGQVYRIFSVAFLFIAIILFFGGIAFKQVATKAPKIILYAILLAVMLKVIQALMAGRSDRALLAAVGAIPAGIYDGGKIFALGLLVRWVARTVA